MRWGKSWLALAVVGLLLGAAHVASRQAPARGPEPRSVERAAPEAGARSSQPDDSPEGIGAAAFDVSEYERRLSRLGLTPEETKCLVFARLESYARHAAKPEPYRYWASIDAATALRRFAAAEAVRAWLREIYGDAAVNEPLFERVFRPLGERFAFLTPSQQVRIQRLRIERDDRVARASLGRPRVVSVEIEREWRARLSTVLDEQALFEYSLRDSVLAEQLRSSGVELSEAEFREAYTTLAGLADDPSTTALRAARASLRALLGTARFDRLWSSRDPIYDVVADLMRARDFDDTTIFAVYGVLSRAQDELASVAALAESEPLRAIEGAREIAAAEMRGIAELVGAEIAEEIVTSRAQALLRRGAPLSFPQWR